MIYSFVYLACKSEPVPIIGSSSGISVVDSNMSGTLSCLVIKILKTIRNVITL